MKKFVLLTSVFFLTACNSAFLAVKPIKEINMSSLSYPVKSQHIKIIDNRSDSEKEQGYVSEYFRGYRLGDTQLNFDRRLLLEQYLNAELSSASDTEISLEEFTLHHVEPETVYVSSRKSSDPDFALATAVAVGGALGGVLSEAIRASERTPHSNGDPYFLCTIKIKHQGKKASIRYYLNQDYVKELNPEDPFASEKYRQGLNKTVDVCLSKTADKLASDSRFQGFSLISR